MKSYLSPIFTTMTSFSTSKKTLLKSQKNSKTQKEVRAQIIASKTPTIYKT
jgi:hypothetical protein